MSRQQLIERKLTDVLEPEFIEVINESSNHNVPPGSESHFKVTVVSAAFDGERLIQRHRRVNQILAEEFADGLHALALHTLSPDEWFERAGHVPESPLCMGGSKG
ncbi:transcriptional regulator BolA [Acidihalobacter aeolianus]|uniref:DNA-binding transcriptional regulator BolA n=1 Tax=Acidihalobacter aeolianus TaxID=2792603 RepID=A0A1D8K9G5_9GAMM|nr:BolA/IbaG family iron-sulfur metabolism protein [Acidihalobacter aeolianus]AOV17619.1 transcriptional regulator BolA [Acidihalobacter aeolianus]